MLYLLALAYSIRLHLCGIYSMKASWRSSLREAEPTESPRVAAVIPAYRESPEVVERAVRSCLSLGVAEVVVVEDLDGCEPRLNALSSPRVKVIAREGRRGWKAGALNEALKHVRCDYILFLDSDFIACPRALDELLSRMSPGVVAVQGYQRHAPAGGWVSKAYSLLMAVLYLVELPGRLSLRMLVQVTGSNTLVRVEAIRELGWRPRILEDLDFTLRAYLSSYRVEYTPLAVSVGLPPPTLLEAIRQQVRWACGLGQLAREHTWRVIRSNLTLREKLDALTVLHCYLLAALPAAAAARTALGPHVPCTFELLHPALSVMLASASASSLIWIPVACRRDGVCRARWIIYLAAFLVLASLPAFISYVAGALGLSLGWHRTEKPASIDPHHAAGVDEVCAGVKP